jgi:hypothetical protein
MLDGTGRLRQRRRCHWVPGGRRLLFGSLLLELVLLLTGLLVLLVLGPRIWRVQLLGRRAMPDGLLLLQGRRRRSAGRGHGLVKRRRGIGTLLAACIGDVSTRYKAMTATARGGTTGHMARRRDRNVAGQVVRGSKGTGRRNRGGPLTSKRGRGGEVRCLLHEAIVELWRRRSGEVVTGIRRGGRESLRLRCSRRDS